MVLDAEVKRKEKKNKVYYPVFLEIHGKRCVVVGGGNVALRKVKMLLDCGATVTVVSPTFLPEFDSLTGNKAICLIHRGYRSGDLKEAAMVIAATDEKDVNEKVGTEARKTGILVNVVDDPTHSDFIVPSFFRRGDLTLAISTMGKSPALAKKIRTKLEQDFGKEYGSLITLIDEVRLELRKKGFVVSAEVWQRALVLDLLIDLVRSDQMGKAKATLLSRLRD
jgi:precorrin-2 dehydrogenase/sirohydrochlorin ferrochelatase